jgi:hypothetical protein
MSESKTLMDSITQAASKKGGDTVPRAAFDQLLQLVQLQNDHMISLSRSIAKHSSSSNKNHSALTHSAPSFEITSPKKKKAKTEKQEKIAKPPSSPEFHAKQTPPVVNQEPLTLEEQETLSEDINNLPEFLLPGAMEIIRQADGVNDDDDEIDLDLDMLDIVTQRKLQHYISQVRCAVALASEHAHISFLPHFFANHFVWCVFMWESNECIRTTSPKERKGRRESRHLQHKHHHLLLHPRQKRRHPIFDPLASLFFRWVKMIVMMTMTSLIPVRIRSK